MSIRRLLALVTLLLLLPGLAVAAPTTISLEEYRGMIRQGVAHLEQAEQLARAGKNAEARRELDGARPFLTGSWQVQTPHGTVEADLREMDELLKQAATNPVIFVRPALDLAREHEAAAEALAQAQPASLPGARESLEKALRQTSARSFLQRIQDWINEILGRRVGEGISTVTNIPPYVYFIGGGIALLALYWLGFTVYRSLSGHGGPGDVTMKTGRDRRPERPPTPPELRALAVELSGRGRHLEALRTAHLALLQQYDSLKLIRYVPAQTNREHEWQLRRQRPDLARTLRSLNDLVDDRLYSGHGATVGDFLQVEALVEQLWREGDAASRGAEAIPGRSSSASSS